MPDVSLHFFFCNDPPPTQIYTLSLHDALPISDADIRRARPCGGYLDARARRVAEAPGKDLRAPGRDRKSTRLNSSHITISYAVFCLKKKKKRKQTQHRRPRPRIRRSNIAHTKR